MGLGSNAVYNISTFLASKYYIPNYQREYSWENEELEDFWSDLEYSIQKNEDHFFGQIVIHVDGDKKYIIDGQQRTTTSIIFLRALSETALNMWKKTNDVRFSKLNSSIDPLIGDDSINGWKLNLDDSSDSEFFIECILKAANFDNAPRKLRKPCARMKNAFIFFENKLMSMLQEQNTDYVFDVLLNIYKIFTDRFKVLYMEADQLDEAFMIFETLNARGKELEVSDLLKNYLFSKAGSNISSVQKKWKEMCDNLGKIEPKKFVRHLWNSCNEFTRDKQLYREISSKVKTPKECADFLESLSKYSNYYFAMSSPEENDIFENNLLVERLANLNTMKATTFYTLVLAMLQQNFSENDIEKVLHSVENYIFKNIIICSSVANKTEVFFAKIALQVSQQMITDADTIINMINKEIVSDEVFSSFFREWKGSTSSKGIIRYILRNIENYLVKSQEIKINDNNFDVHIEHIMPVDRTNWVVLDDDHDEYLWNLGNLTLLGGKLNEKISNNAFEDKKKTYSDSLITMTKELCNYNTWDIESIKDRQAHLTTIALEVWK